MSANYEVLAIRYGFKLGARADTFYKYRIYGQPDGPLPMDYFFWVIRNGTDVLLVDSGFSSASPRPGRSLTIERVEALEQLGIAPQSVSQIIVSHGHSDHIGNLSSFPEAILTMQKRELDFWMSDLPTRCPLMFTSEPAEIEELRRANREGRIRIIDGDATVLPGISVQRVGGHCPGQQITLVDTENSRVVLASDALHYYEEMEREMPFISFTDLVDTYRAYETLRTLERGGATIVAGHDPLVMERFPSASSTTDSLAVRVG